MTEICFAGKELWKCQKKVAIAVCAFKKIIDLRGECAVDAADTCYAQRVAKQAIGDMNQTDGEEVQNHE